MTVFPLKFVATAALISLASASQAMTWAWSFGDEHGTFTTDGTGSAGSYVVSDFSVEASGVGATIGSFSGGAYSANNLGTTMPYGFDWDGSKITAWHKMGVNTFAWNIYQNMSKGDQFYFFGWATGNLNEAMSATYFNMTTNSALSVGQLTITAVPEPETYLLMLAGLGLLGAAVRARGHHHSSKLPS